MSTGCRITSLPPMMTRLIAAPGLPEAQDRSEQQSELLGIGRGDVAGFSWRQLANAFS